MIARQLKIKLALKLQRRISEYLNRLRGIRLLPPGSESPALVSLAPRLLDSQEMSQYSEELKFAFEDDRNLNIALTGAYGAGRPAIILSRTFFEQKSHPWPREDCSWGCERPQTPASGCGAATTKSGYRRPAAAATPLCLSRLYSSPVRMSAHTTQSIFRATAQTA